MFSWRRKKCDHLHVRCIHGDEILYAAKHYLRWWKASIIYRQMCMDCNTPLDRPSICSQLTGIHYMQGVRWLGENKR